MGSGHILYMPVSYVNKGVRQVANRIVSPYDGLF